MRSFVLVLVTTLAACEAARPGGGPGDPAGPDGNPGGSGDASLPPPARGFQILSPTVDINPGVEVTFCYYFRAPNTTDLSIKKWASHMTTGSHHMILYLTDGDQQTPGTLSTAQCDFLNGGHRAVWTYSAQTPDAEAALPADDGTGIPVGQPIKAGQSGFIQMHYLNASDYVLHAHVELNAYAYDDGVQVTPAGPYVTYNERIQIPPGSEVSPAMGSAGGTCNVPLDSAGKPPRFYVMSTHTHKQGVHTAVTDGTTTVFQSTDWEHPGSKAWNTAPFYSFASSKLTYRCDYLNPTGNTIFDGPSAATDEMCMAIGYYFPAVSGMGHFCLDSTLVY